MFEGVSNYMRIKRAKKIINELGLNKVKWNQESHDGCSIFE